ncbi:MAG: hypothetical protein ACXABG_02195 [Promethearchaeota archaeon]|jgi:chromosome segregation ATPase
MPEENEKVEDFISLWKKKLSTENTPSVVGDLQKENEFLRSKIAANIDLITKSEEILKKAVEEKEKLRLEKSEAVTEISFQLNELTQQNSELEGKIKSMVKLLLEKDEDIKAKDKLISNLQATSGSSVTFDSSSNDALVDELRAQIVDKNTIIQDLELKISNLTKEIEKLNEEQVEKLRDKPVDYIVEVASPEPEVIKPQPPESTGAPLELLIQDLQSDLTKYKRIIETLKQEKVELKNALQGEGQLLNEQDLEDLKKENESLKKDLEDIQKFLKSGKTEAPKVDTSQLEEQITHLENKLREKDSVIADLKLSAISPTEVSGNPMAELVENLQKNINKLKTTINEKDSKILELNKRISQM